MWVMTVPPEENVAETVRAYVPEGVPGLGDWVADCPPPQDSNVGPMRSTRANSASAALAVGLARCVSPAAKARAASAQIAARQSILDKSLAAAMGGPSRLCDAALEGAVVATLRATVVGPFGSTITFAGFTVQVES